MNGGYLMKKPVEIVSEEQLHNLDSKFAVVRLSNKKLALMVKSGTEWEPFYPQGIETGFWDFRRYGEEVDYHRLFKNLKRLGANTCWFMLKWQEVEPSDGYFDFRFADEVVQIAERYDTKLVWVFFTHVHCNDTHLSGDNYWMYNLDNQDGTNLAIQWVKDEQGNLYDSIEKLNMINGQLFPCYAHPVVFEKINRVTKEIARHYRHSSTVIGVQIGNEEGFLHEPFADGYDTDYNPYTRKLFESWGGKDDDFSWGTFKNAMVKSWWRHFTSAYHEEDPYKITSLNFQGGHPEKGDEKWMFRTGTDASTYGQGNIDVVGTMFYEHDYDDIWTNLDSHYNYVYDLPLLIPSEIGLGIWGTESYVLAQHYLVNTLKRGAQGYDFYAYGHFFDANDELTRHGEILLEWNYMIRENIDILWSAIPGSQEIDFSTRSGAEISWLTNQESDVLGILYFPEAHQKENADFCEDRSDTQISIHVQRPATYEIIVYCGKNIVIETTTFVQVSFEIMLPDLLERSLIFIKVKLARPVQV